MYAGLKCGLICAGLLLLQLLNTGCEYTNVDPYTMAEPTPLTTQPAIPNEAGDGADDPAPDTGGPVTGGEGIGPNGGGGGFLWKPVSESNSKLVVLLPSRYTGKTSAVFVGGADGSVIEQGNYSGVHNGGREHYRFSKQGAQYGDNVYVVADLEAGGSVHWVVGDGSVRTEF